MRTYPPLQKQYYNYYEKRKANNIFWLRHWWCEYIGWYVSNTIMDLVISTSKQLCLLLIFLFGGSTCMLTHASISKSNSASSSNAKQDVVYTADRESYEPIRRLKREDVSKIKHLYDETRIDEHSEAGKEAIVQKHNEYRSSPTTVASNKEHMVSGSLNAFHAAGEHRRQVKFNQICTKMSKLWNFMTMFGTTVKNAFRYVQTCLVSVH